MSLDEELGKVEAEIKELENLIPTASELERIALRYQIAAEVQVKAALLNNKSKHESDGGGLLVTLFNFLSSSSSVLFSKQYASYTSESDLASPHSKSGQVSAKESDAVPSREISVVNDVVISQALRKRKTKLFDEGS